VHTRLGKYASPTLGVIVKATSEPDELAALGTAGNDSGRGSSAGVRVVRTEVDAAEVVRLRLLACAGENWFDPSSDVQRDAAGIVWLLDRFDQPVASARALPFTSGLSFFAEIDAPLHLLPLDDSWVELGRLVAERSSAGFMAAQLLFRECANWLLEHTAYRHGYAMCDTKMVPYYRRFGMQASQEGYHLTCSGKPLYSHLLHCDLAEIVRS
jgi:hypothetical protein